MIEIEAKGKNPLDAAVASLTFMYTLKPNTSPNQFLQDLSCRYSPTLPLGSLRKPQRRRQHRQTKDLMSRTITVFVRYNSLYISLPSSAKQEHEMTKFCVV